MNQFAIYPGCEEKIDNYVEYFNMKLSHDVEERLPKIKMDKILQKSGDYFAKLHFIIDENGYFSNITFQGNETLGRIATQILYKINREQEENSTKIKPALINENPVKVYFNIPIRYNN
ncbi:MAG: hypothetical protein ACRC8Z_13955 [Empedobacter falsenii]